MSEVDEHIFNSRWLGVAYGITDSIEILSLTGSALSAAVGKFHIVEVRGNVEEANRAIGQLNPAFRYIDTQLSYVVSTIAQGLKSDLNVAPVEQLQSSSKFEFRFATFDRERYQSLNGISQDEIQDRYRLWASDLIESTPKTCLVIEKNGKHVGYFFCHAVNSEVVFLDMIVRAKDADVKGSEIYTASSAFLHQLGYLEIHAGVSVHNLPSLQMHARLGCTFTKATDIWIGDFRSH